MYENSSESALDGIPGGAVLEIGAASSEMSVLCMEALSRASEKAGINLARAPMYRDFEIHQRQRKQQ